MRTAGSGGGTSGPEEATKWDLFAAAAVPITLWISWPVLQVIGGGPVLFLARGAHPVDVFAVGLAIGMVLPLIAGAASALLPRPASTYAFMLANVVSSLGLSGRILHFMGGNSVILWVVLALGLAICFQVLFDRSRTARQLIRYLVASPLIVLAFFLLATPAHGVAFAEEPPLLAPIEARVPAPVVLVVFDELPTSSIIMPSGDINSDWYPGFAGLQADSVWYRNAATVHQQTDQAVPAILTGTIPDVGELPIRSEHPQNIFTLLGPEYSILSQELVTDLCPPERCSEPLPEPAIGERWGLLAEDLGYVGAHTLLPQDLTVRLPSIDRQWANFGKVTQNDASHSPREEVEVFIDATRGLRAEPSFVFLHAMLPHRPWVYLPDGTFYGGDQSPASVGMGVDTRWQTDQSQQRHLLQTQYADRLLTRLISSLKEADVYERALVVVTADHGISFTSAGGDRIVTPDSVEEIGSVPLFIKYPHGEGAGVIDDYRALTIDILPTIADVIDLEIPSPVDGMSLATGFRPDRKTTITFGSGGATAWSSNGLGKYEAAAHIRERFPSNDPFTLVLEGTPEIIGRRSDEIEGFMPAEGWELVNGERFQRVGDAGVTSPAFVGGRSVEATPGQWVAVAVNDVIRGVTRSYRSGPDVWAFDVVINPSLFVQGLNDIDIFVKPGVNAARKE